MFLAGSRDKASVPGRPDASPNPFKAQVTGGTAPAGPGVGAPRAELFTDALMRRRRWAAHTLGDTPMRDGPFGPSAAVAAVDFPPKARQEVRKKFTGLNPFTPSEQARG
jgi:hypothetical protein